MLKVRSEIDWTMDYQPAGKKKEGDYKTAGELPKQNNMKKIGLRGREVM